ncbi:MAG: ribosome biogenesis GTP-binding protein YihA/YsxC [Cyclobacteriaceae bacterium]
MEIKQAEFVSSVADVKKCPPPDKPEFAFIGRSNVGKSSLLNMLANQKKLAKTSNKPGKTQTINHFIINTKWYMVDLPGYGYASVSKEKREGFGQIIENYVLKRENLNCLFILLDARLEPQKIDLQFIQWTGEKEVPLCIIFTKTDKLTKNQLNKNMRVYRSTLLTTWEELPVIMLTSAVTKSGKEDVLSFIEKALAQQP